MIVLLLMECRWLGPDKPLWSLEWLQLCSVGEVWMLGCCEPSRYHVVSERGLWARR